MDYYKLYLEYKKNPIEPYSDKYYKIDKFGIKHTLGSFIDRIYSIKSIDELYDYKKSFHSYKLKFDRQIDLNFNIIQDFPPKFLIDLCIKFIDGEYFDYHYSTKYEILKFLYKLIPKYINISEKLIYPESEYHGIVQKYKYRLLDISNMIDTNLKKHNKYKEKFKSKIDLYHDTGRLICNYHLDYHLYALFSVLPEGDKLIYKICSFMKMNDAEDSLLLGILWMAPEKLKDFFLPFITKIINDEDNGLCFDPFCSGTGAYSYIFEILLKIMSQCKDGKKIITSKEYNIIYENDYINQLTYDLFESFKEKHK